MNTTEYNTMDKYLEILLDESSKLKCVQKITTDVIGQTHEAEMYQEKQDSKNSEICDSSSIKF